MYENEHSIRGSAESRAKALRSIKQRRRMTQKDLGKILEVGQPQVSRYLRGDADLQDRPAAVIRELLKLAVGAEERAPLLELAGVDRIPGPHPVVASVEALVEKAATGKADSGWLDLIADIVDLALDGKEAPPEVAAVIRYWREASADERADLLRRAATPRHGRARGRRTA